MVRKQRRSHRLLRLRRCNLSGNVAIDLKFERFGNRQAALRRNDARLTPGPQVARLRNEFTQSLSAALGFGAGRTGPSPLPAG